MIQINNFQINTDATQIDVSLEADAGETVTKVLLWTNKTFQNYSLAIDLTDKLEGVSNIEEFIITTSDAGVGTFSGIFFIEVETSNQVCEGCGLIGVAANLTRYNECLLDKVLRYSACLTGNCKEDQSIMDISIVLDATSISLQNSYYLEAIDLLCVLDKLCPDCSDCKTLSVYCANSGLTFGTLNGTLILI